MDAREKWILCFWHKTESNYWWSQFIKIYEWFIRLKFQKIFFTSVPPRSSSEFNMFFSSRSPHPGGSAAIIYRDLFLAMSLGFYHLNWLCRIYGGDFGIVEQTNGGLLFGKIYWKYDWFTLELICGLISSSSFWYSCCGKFNKVTNILCVRK